MSPPSAPLPGPESLAFLETLYAQYRSDPRSVDADWRRWFESLDREDDAAGNGRAAGNGHGAGRPFQLGPSFPRGTVFAPASARTAPPAAIAEAPAAGSDDRRAAVLQHRAETLLRAYRVRGHLLASLDPLGLPRPPQIELDPTFHSLGEADLDRRLTPGTLPGLEDRAPTLREVLDRLRNTYCRSIGVQFMHIDELRPKDWLQNRMERSENRLEVSRATQLRILTKLTDAVIFEEFIQKAYLGAKRFSLEGGESLIPLLDLAIEKAGRLGVQEVVLAMAHRGRLNVLANTMGKPATDIFHEFDDRDPELFRGSGDVKYHLGFASDHVLEDGRKVHLSLCFNPSHLEFVNPVALGRTRAKQDRRGDTEHHPRALAVLIHGDAAFSGQGVTQETLNLSNLDGYRVGGALHIIVNNQIGFTTQPAESRSSTYATSVAKMLASPIFHVNGEDPEAVAQVVELALDFRQEFRRDVVIDMYCYRRYGHNEGDEPAFTQPLLYDAIRRRKSVRQGYVEHLVQMGGVSAAEADAIRDRRRAQLEKELEKARSEVYVPKDVPKGPPWHLYRAGRDQDTPEVDTGISPAMASDLLRRLATLPPGFEPHPKIRRLLEERHEMADGGRALHWSAGEALAFASLAVRGTRVRLTGQDSVRGTFSHRHAVLFDPRNGSGYCPLRNLAPDQGPVEIYNSPLSEIGVLGYEYGYSLDSPDALVMWEAQFGDFANVAQVIVDQFLASAEDKWNRFSALVLLLPHGYEGMGPEHSSARIERFLTLAAEDNLQIVQPTTPAQMFHVLRRQVLRPLRKPLVVFTPKSLLRLPECVSRLEDFSGRFQRVLKDPDDPAPAKTELVLLCSGKIHYELRRAREERARKDVALVRLEQLYPLHDAEIARVLKGVPAKTPVRWVQDEPANSGAASHLRLRFGASVLGRHPFEVVSRPASASPATGSHASHDAEQKDLLEAAFAKAKA